MSTKTFVQPDSSTQTAAAYPGVVDAAISVLARVGDNFAPHAQATPDMTVALDAGHLMNGQTLVEQAAQSTGTITAPTTNPRIDRIVVDNATGTVSVVTGVESATPVAPAIPAGKSPVAQVLLQTTSTAITNAMLTDERDFTNMGTTTGALLNVQTFTSSGTYTPTPGTTKIVVEVQGGGGSGGGTAATGASTCAASSGGSAGAYAKALVTSGFSGVSVTIGAGGAAPTSGPNNGNAGATSSFGSLVSSPGGPGGLSSAALSPGFTIGVGLSSSAPTGGNIVNASGGSGSPGIGISLTGVVGGDGAASFFGGAGAGRGSGAGLNGVAPGAGGGGSGAVANTAARSAGAGAAGIVIIHEYA